MTTQNFLFIFLSLYTIQSYGMEQKNNLRNIKPAAQEHKHAENRATRKGYQSTIDKLCRFLKDDKAKFLPLQEKKSLKTSLEENMRRLDACYSQAETWSEDDLEAHNDGKQLIESLKK